MRAECAQTKRARMFLRVQIGVAWSDERLINDGRDGSGKQVPFRRELRWDDGLNVEGVLVARKGSDVFIDIVLKGQR